MYSIARYLLAFALALFPPSAHAGDQDLCPTKTLDKGNITGVYTGIIEQDGMPAQIGILMKGDDEPTHLFADRETAAKIFGDAVGKLVSASYELQQYWNEAEMWCFRGEVLVAGKILGNAPASPQKQACSPKVLETRTVSGVYHGLVNNDIDVYSIALGIPDSDDFLIQSSQKEADKWFGNANGKNVAVTFQLTQSWDDREQRCAHGHKIIDVKFLATPPAAKDQLSGIYEYGTPGMSGDLELGAANYENLRSLSVHTVNNSNSNLCDYEGQCKSLGKNIFVCSQDGAFSGENPADASDSPVRLRAGGGLVEVITQNSDACGAGAFMLGKYTLKK